jgi:Sulfotransferase domain.
VATPDPARDASLAAGYREHLARLFPDAGDSAYLTDKRPDNFLLIGLAKRMLPEAKIVHTIRNPLDNGLSVFMQHLHLQVAGYSADLADIGHYYGQYRRLMAHWKALYPDSILDFDYDAFVRRPAPALERLFAFLGLDTDDRCLRFHELGNTVKTASYWQVRQPLSDRASGRWRNYERHLGPLRQSLREAGIAIDDA